MYAKKLPSYLSRLKEIRKNLLGDVEKNLKSSQEGTTEPVADISDGAARAYTSEIMLNLGEQDWQKLKQVDQALAKISTGEYGICALCEEPIPEARLEVIPFTEYCVECLSKIEQDKASAVHRSEEPQTEDFE